MGHDRAPLAILNLKQIAQAAASAGLPLTCFVMGTNDLIKATRARAQADRLPLLAWLSLSVAAARAFGLTVVDGVYNAIQDRQLAARRVRPGPRAEHGRQDADPSQPDRALQRSVFAMAEEIAAARKIVEAFALPENQGKGAISLDGRMVRLLHAEIASQTLDMAAAIAERG